MTKHELIVLNDLLRKFRAFIDEQDAESIRKASSIGLAGRLCAQHELNAEKINSVITWVGLKMNE